MAGLADAARCRSESDWLIGINGTRALTKRMFGSRAGNVASVGRVQTPPSPSSSCPRVGDPKLRAPQLLARHRQLRRRQGPVRRRRTSDPISTRRATTSTTASTASGTRPWREAILAACAGQPLAVVTEEEGQHPGRAPPLRPDHPPAGGQQPLRSSRAERTLQIAQALYERHKMITYPRTDSRALPEDYMPTVRETLQNLHERPRHARAEGARRTAGCSPNKRIFNNEQISDHFAIIPTAHEAKNLDDIEAKVFDMIARRFVAAFHPAAEFDVTTRTSTVAPRHHFKTEGKVLTLPGWLAVYGKNTVDDESADSKALPAITAADVRLRRPGPWTPSSTQSPPSRRHVTRRPPCFPPWKRRASSSATRIMPTP
jgi:DNA topoisomerase-3